MANPNTPLTPTIIAREALRLLKNNLVMGNQVYRAYEAEFPGTPRKGGTVTIRKPVRFKVTKSRVRSSSVITEQSITLTVSTQAHVSWAFAAVELTLTIEEYSARYISPAAAVLANTIDADLTALYADVYNEVHESTGFVTPNTFMVLGKAMQRLDEEACPPEERCIVFNPAAHWSMANALSALYAPAVAEKALRKGFLGTIANCDIYMDQNIKVHTSGQYCTTGCSESNMLYASTQIPSASTPGATDNHVLCVEGIAITTRTTPLQAGDVLTIDGVHAVNPMSGESTGVLRNFVVTTDVVTTTESTAKDTLVYVYPEIISTGPYKTVDTVPASAAAVLCAFAPLKNYPQNLAFHKNAFALCMVPLQVPDGVGFSSSVTEDGYSIRIVKDYDIDNDLETIRLDVLYGVKTIYPELAVRISGAVTSN
jgi:hypothetical protein